MIVDTQTAATTATRALGTTVGPASVHPPEGVVSIDVTFLVRAALAADR